MTWKAIPAEEVCDLLDFWRTAAWPMTTEATNEHAAALGWTVEDEDFLVNGVSGLSLTDVNTSTMPSGELAALNFWTTDVIREEGPPVTDFLDDQFALQVRAGTQRWGKPDLKRTKDGGRTAEWDFVDAGGRITLMRLDSSIVADFTTPQYADVLRGLGE